MPLRKKPLLRKRTLRKNVKEERSESSPAKFKDHIEVIGKIALGVVASCYAVGILVESLYLGSFGVYNVNLFRFTYVFAGAWALLFFLMPMAPVILGICFLIFVPKDFNTTSFLLRNAYILVSVILLPIFLYIFGGVLISLILKIEIPRSFFLFLVFLDIVTLLLVLFIYLYRNDRDTVVTVFKTFFCFIIIIVFIAFLGAFSKDMFPRISPNFGGGKSLTVQLLLEANKQNAWMIQKNFDLCDSDKAKITAPEEVQLVATKPMPLLLATDTDYIIRKDENTAVSITRDQVKTVLYLDNFDYSTNVCSGAVVPAPSSPVVPPPQR